MNYYPLFAELTGQACLVIGGGEVALRKVRQLLRAGSQVTVNAPELCAELADLASRAEICHAAGDFDPALIDSHLLIIAATSDSAVNHAVAAASRAAMRLCNVVDDGPASSFIVPAVVDRSPIVVAIGSGGEAPLLARVLRQRLDDWLPARLGELAAWIGKWRRRAGDQLGGYRDRVRFWQDIVDGPIAEQVLDGRRARADANMAALLQDGLRGQAGEAWLVGAGPGDPGLLTRRGLELLQRADTVMHDALVAPEILDFARRDAELVSVGKRGGRSSTAQDAINTELVRRVTAGERVCRLKGGDPFVFGRGGEELQALSQAGLPYQVVPGVTAANACSAYTGIPLTHRGVASGYIVVTGHPAKSGHEPDWASLTDPQLTLVIYMGTRRLASLCTTLVEAGRAACTPAAVVEQGSTAGQRVIGADLASIPAQAAAAGLGTPSLLIVGDVVAMADELAWFETSSARAASAVNE
jgi:uroporphyrin-III C-methyltransferase/precorrin-2 dehydrogenase/sirohydrochlorin ferrochelatase